MHATGAVNLFGREHELVVGYNGSKAENTGNEYAHGELAPVGNFFEWDGSYPEPDFDATGYLLQDIDSRQNGLYVAGRFVLADRVKAIAGARYSTWETDHFYLYELARLVETFHDEYEKVIPYAGLIFDISKNYSAFASFTEIFKPQLARDANSSYLDPIDGNSVEFGIKGEHFDARLNTALTLFETKQDNVAEPAFDDDGNPIMLDRTESQASIAIDGTRTRGFEFEASGALGKRWNASLGWTRYIIEDADGLAVRTFVPQTMVRGFTTWRPAAIEKLTLGAGINWQSDSFTQAGGPNGGILLREGDVTQISLMARYQFTPKISVQLNGSNLLDETYYVLDNYDNTPLRRAAGGLGLAELGVLTGRDTCGSAATLRTLAPLSAPAGWRIHGYCRSSQPASPRRGHSASLRLAHHVESGRSVQEAARRGLEQDALVRHGGRTRCGADRDGAQARILTPRRQAGAEVRQGREAARSRGL